MNFKNIKFNEISIKDMNLSGHYGEGIKEHIEYCMKQKSLLGNKIDYKKYNKIRKFGLYIFYGKVQE